MNDRLRRTKKSARPGSIWYGKFTIDCASPVHRRPIGVLRSEAHDSAEARRNYIGLLHEETEEQRVADISAAAKHRIIGLMAAMIQPPQRSEIVTRAAATLNEGPGTTARSGSRSQKLR